MQVALEVLEQLSTRCHISPLCKEVFYFLQRPHIQVRERIYWSYFEEQIQLKFFLLQSVLCAHDAIAQKDFYPHLPEIPVEVDEDEETVKIVQLVKNSEPLVS